MSFKEASAYFAQETVNVSHRLRLAAERDPKRPAVIALSGRGRKIERIDYAGLEKRSNAIAFGLKEIGVRPKDRVSVFLRPGVDLISVSYALFKMGAAPVLIDPGMGRAPLATCIEKAAPRVMIAVPAAQAFRALHKRAFRTVEVSVTAGSKWRFGGTRLDDLIGQDEREFPIEETRSDETAAVLFTSGSTGPAKGVVYTHGIFEHQVQILQELYRFDHGEVDVACFPLFALFDVALEMTSVFPEMDPSHPSRCDPMRIVEAIERFAATTSFGSPAIWQRVAPWCAKHGKQLDTLKRVLSAGAPISPELIAACRGFLRPGAEVYTPYGATEALPVSSVDGRTLTKVTRKRAESGYGTCVGTLAPQTEVRLIRVHDDPIAQWSEDLEVKGKNELGEICVRSPIVTPEYLDDEGATQAAKIQSDHGLWHRMGDVGYWDDEGRLWFCGRSSHRLETTGGMLMPVPYENVVNLHPGVRRSALVGVGPRGRERPVLIVEAQSGAHPKTEAERQAFEQELSKTLDFNWKNGPRMEIDAVLFKDALPVDVRHNAKIRREELKAWAEKNLR